jgi:hypothetical protein
MPIAGTRFGVTGGVRVCLAYNLVLRTGVRRGVPPPSAAPDDVLAEALASWIAAQPAEPLVFALEHHYTQRGLSLDLLKGGDRQLADLVVAAAEKSDCLAHLARISGTCRSSPTTAASPAATRALSCRSVH